MTRTTGLTPRAIGLAVAMALAMTACGGGDNEPTQADVLVDAYVASTADASGMPEEDAECAAQATVDAIGADRLGAATSPEEIRANPIVLPSELDIEVSPEEEGQAFYDGITDCFDLREHVTTGMDATEARCFDEHIDDALLEELIRSHFASAERFSPELDAALVEAYGECGAEDEVDDPQAELSNLITRRSQAGGQPVTVITYNVRGLLRKEKPRATVDQDMTRFARLTGEVVADEQADFVVLQEICGTQADLIAQTATANGWPMYVVAVDLVDAVIDDYHVRETCGQAHEGGPNDSTRYGRAVLSHHPAVEFPAPGGVRALCIRATETPVPMKVCNFHINPGEGASEIPAALKDTDEPLIAAGDFNTVPDVDPVRALHDSMYEADIANRATAAPLWPLPLFARKIDHIFAHQYYFDDDRTADVREMFCPPLPQRRPQRCSDHFLLTARFTLLVDKDDSGGGEPGDGVPEGLLNGTYEFDCGSGTQSFTLTDGQHQDNFTSVTLQHAHLVGLDADDEQEATVLLSCSSGANLAVDTVMLYEERGGNWERVDEQPLQASLIQLSGGESTQPQGAIYETYDPVYAAGDPRCCPSSFERSVYSVDLLFPEVFHRIQGPETIAADDPDAPTFPAPG